MKEAKNVLGSKLVICCTSPLTGFYRNGRCDVDVSDFGTHSVCAQITAEFLKYTQSLGNDLITPVPAYNFPGLKPGDRWCLCAGRWVEAKNAGFAPPIVLESTHEVTLQYVSLEELKKYALAKSEDEEENGRS